MYLLHLSRPIGFPLQFEALVQNKKAMQGSTDIVEPSISSVMFEV